MKSYAIFQHCAKFDFSNALIGKFSDINKAYSYLNWYAESSQCSSCVYEVKEYVAPPNDKSSIPGAISQGKPLCCVEEHCEQDKLGLFDRFLLKLKKFL